MNTPIQNHRQPQISKKNWRKPYGRKQFIKARSEGVAKLNHKTNTQTMIYTQTIAGKTTDTSHLSKQYTKIKTQNLSKT